MAVLNSVMKPIHPKYFNMMLRLMSGKKLIPMDLVTGLEKRELKEYESDDDPYGISIKRGPGTKDQPTLIPSAFSARLVGCICPDDSFTINYMWLHKGELKRCGCGHWFKLVERAPV